MKIGEGYSSLVFQEGDFAVKRFREQIPRQMIENEIQLMSQLQHANLVRVYEFSLDGWIKMELLQQKVLFDYVNTRHHLSMNVIQTIFKQLISVIQYIHSQGCVHRDIKLENVYFDDVYNIRLGDLGFAINVSEQRTARSHVGTPGYLAPELMRTQTVDSKQLYACDIYSLGVMLFIMVHRIEFTYFIKHGGLKLIENQNWTRIWQSLHRFNPNTSPDLQNLLEGMLQIDPEKRITMEQILTQSFYVNDKTDNELYQQEMSTIRLSFATNS